MAMMTRQDCNVEDGGRLHPHTDHTHTGLVILVSFGATCEFVVDMEKNCQVRV
jgi:hypothetical protein